MIDTTPEQWKLGGEVIDQGLKHPALATITQSWTAVVAALVEVQQSSAAMKRVGAGRTEDPTLLLAKLVPALREHAELVSNVAAQLEARLK
jgi:hypothetical protein